MDDLAPFMNKKYKLASSENFDEFLKAVGVGWMPRKIIATVSPIIELSEKDGVYTLSSSSTFKTTETKFKLGEEFDEDIPDGTKAKSVITRDGCKLVHVQRGEKVTTIIREFSADQVKQTISVDDIVSTRIYKPL